MTTTNTTPTTKHDRTHWLPNPLRNDLHKFVRAVIREIALSGDLADTTLAHTIVSLDFATREPLVGLCLSERYAARIDSMLCSTRIVVEELTRACARQIGGLEDNESNARGFGLRQSYCRRLRVLSELQATGAAIMFRIAKIAWRNNERTNAPANDTAVQS